jgi:dTDP-4-amino-4,6-dideoxygalactose transaminase
VALTGSARAAIYALSSLLRLPAGTEVLAPAYNCGTELDALVKSGLAVKLYRVDGQGRIDVDDIRRRLTPQTRLIYLIHYFGFPQRLDEVLALCRSHDIYMVEDCALALFSGDQRGPLGRQGDIAIFSLPKTLPVADGGLLVINREELRLLERRFARHPPLRRLLRRWMPVVKGELLRRLNRLSAALACALDATLTRRSMANENGERFHDLPLDYYYTDDFTDRCLSPISHFILKRANPDKIVAQRRANYFALHTRLKNIPGVKMLFNELPDGVCPLALPLIVADRHGLYNHLRRNHIPAIPWWSGYHPAFDWDEFPAARHLKDHVIALPIHHALETAHVDHIATVVATALQQALTFPPAVASPTV